MKGRFISLFLLAYLAVFSQKKDLLWLRQLSGIGTITNTSIIKIPGDQGFFVTGNFTSQLKIIDFPLNSNGGYDIFIAKFSNDGYLLWAQQIGGSSNESVYSLAISKNGEFLYVGGSFLSSNCKFANGAVTLSTTGNADIFLAKYNSSDGSLVWAIDAAYETTQQVGGVITVDNDDNILLLGKYIDKVTFYPGSLTLNSSYSGISQNFCAKFNPNGNIITVFEFPGNNSSSTIRSVTADDHAYYFTGFYQGDIQIASNNYTSYLDSKDIIIFSLDSHGELLWLRKIFGSSDDIGFAHAINSNLLYFAGYYSSAALHIDSTETAESQKSLPNTSGNEDAIIGCYSKDGQLQWVTSFNSSGYTAALSVFANNEKVVFSGDYTGTTTFGDTTLNSSSTDAFHLEVDKNGIILSVHRGSGDNIESGQLALIDDSHNNTNIFVGKFYSSTFYLNNKTLTNTGFYDGYIAKFGNINLSFNVTNNLCAGESNGSIDLTISGDGLPPYTYQWSGPNGFSSTSEDIYNLVSGTYYVTVTDQNGATKVGSAQVTEPWPLGAIYNKTNPSCYGSTNGSIQLFVFGGTPPATCLWNTGSTSFNLYNLSAGTYSYTITDANNCSISGSITLTQPSDINITATITPPSCVPGNDGTIDITVTGGTPPYTYLWSNGSTNEDISSIGEGTYTVTVTDSYGCTKIKSIDVIIPLKPSVSAIVQNVSCLSPNSGSIDLIVSNGTPPYTYIWNDGQTTEDRTNLSAGTYSVTVTDDIGCTAEKNNINVLVTSPITLSTAVTNVSCFPGHDGSIDLIVSNGNPPYTYLWNDGQTVEDRTNLNAGIYRVTVTDANGCTAEKNNIVVNTSTPPSLSYLATNPSCNPGNDGTIDLIVYNGNPPFNYLWNNGSHAEDLSNLDEGQYKVTVTDSKNCTSTLTVNLASDTPVVNIMYYGNTSFCYGDSLLLYATNNFGWTYEWYLNSNSIINSNVPVFAAKDSGSYFVVAIASNGCKGTSNVVNINVHQLPNVNIFSSSNFICQGNSVLLTASGASTYIWSNGITSSSQTVQPLSTTTYYVTGTNNIGCSNVASVTITVNPNPEISAVVNDETCGDGNGSINLTVTNGQPPYNYQWSNGLTTQNINNLNDGHYTVTVTDAFNCSAVYSATVNPFVPLSASINTHNLIIFCENISNGVAHVIANNGLAPYTYQWSNGINNAYNSQLGTGINYVTVTDQCNNSVIDSIVVTNLPSLNISITNVQPATCSYSANGSAQVVTFNGVPPFSYTWSNSNSTTNVANDLPVGMQYVTVTDYCGSKVDSVYISNLPPMQASIASFSQVTCSGLSDASATVFVLDGVAPFSFVWSNGETTQTATHLGEGLQSVTVTDACGWSILSVNITAPTPLSISIIESSPASCSNTSDGYAHVSAINGTQPYSYNWSSGENTAYAGNLTVGWNYVTVTDACTSLVDSVYISVKPPLTASIAMSSEATCKNFSDGKAFVLTENGVAPFHYTWSNSTSTSNYASDLPAGWNYVTVTDLCTSVVDSVYIMYRTPLNPQVTVIPSKCSNDSSGSAIVIPYFGVPPYSFSWSYSNNHDSILTNLPVGNYFVTVSDFCGDTVISFAVGSKPPLHVSVEKKDVNCFGQNTGSITLIAHDGVAPYSYIWKDNQFTGSSISSLIAGWYYYTVTDYCGSVSDSVLINQNPPLAIVLNSIKNATFEEVADGSIDITVIGGTPPYSYFWSNGQTTEDAYLLLPNTYNVSISDFYNCQISKSFKVDYDAKDIVIYNTFTPNGDGKNDVWNIKYIEYYPACEVNVYDQWGKKVFESKGYSKPWDGKSSNGKELPAGTYYYVIDLKNGKNIYQGSLTIIK